MEIEIKRHLFKTDKPAKEFAQAGRIPEEVFTAREAAIRYGKVSIVALDGQVTGLEEYFGSRKECWQEEPFFGFEQIVSSNAEDKIKAFEASASGRNKIWSYLELSAKKMMTESGEKIDLKLLTPGLAVKLIEKTIRDNIAYENVLAANIRNIVLFGEQGITTSRPELIELAKTYFGQFEVEAKKVYKEFDSMTADQILDIGFGICTHISALATVMYEVLKERQEGILLNGSYLIYHDEGNENQLNVVVGQHAYNMLIVTTPKKEVNLSVLDFTFSLSNDDLDKTWLRISQACGFLTQYGELLEVAGLENVVDKLATEGKERLEKYFHSMKLPLYSVHKEKSISGYLNDYVALIGLTKAGAKEGAAKSVMNIFINKGETRIKAIRKMLAMPSYFTINISGEISLKTDRFREINRELDLINFGDGQIIDRMSVLDIFENTIRLINTGDFRKTTAEGGSVTLGNYTFESLSLIAHFVRGCVATGFIPNKSYSRTMIEKSIALSKKYSLKNGLVEMEGRYRKLLTLRG